MEGNLNMMPGGGSYGGLDMQGSMRFNHLQQPGGAHHGVHQLNQVQPRQAAVALQSSMQDGFPPLTMGSGMNDCDHQLSMTDHSKGHRGRNNLSDDEEHSLNDDPADGNTDSVKAKKGSQWHRVKWTDKMVRILITAVSYIDEDAASEYGSGGRRKFAVLQKKGKWKSVSKVMAERDFFVSPQQCEDKFNDLNKRYKRLNDILGRGTSCQVVENPALLEMMDNLSEKAKEDVRKILSSKHLFYEEMCSYHNSNRLHLPPDPALQRSLQMALRSREDNESSDMRRQSHDDYEEDDLDAEVDDHDDYLEGHTFHGDRSGTCPGAAASAKRPKKGHGSEELNLGNPVNSQGCNKSNQAQLQTLNIDMNQVFPEGSKSSWYQNQWMKSRFLQLEERKVEIQIEMLELENQHFKWRRFSKKRDRELDMLKLDNERMKLENGRMEIELKRKRMESGL